MSKTYALCLPADTAASNYIKVTGNKVIDSTKWVADVKSGAQTKYRQADPDMLGIPGNILIKSNQVPNVYANADIQRPFQSVVKSGRHVYVQVNGCVSATDSDTGDINLYPVSGSISLQCSLDPTASSHSLNALHSIVQYLYHLLAGPYTVTSVGGDDMAISFGNLDKIVSGETEVLDDVYAT